MVKSGDHVDRYLIEEPIGEGGMGRVFRALDARLERHVALKVLHDAGEGPESRARLVREARAVAKLDHPNIVAVYDVGEHESGPFVVMELIEGRSLRSLIDDPTVTPNDRVRAMVEVARALAVAHDAGIVHRDVKPENILVRKDARVKVVDFGIARRAQTGVDPSAPTSGVALSTLTADGVKVGTPTYMAPEQIRGAGVDGRVDQFAWGVTAYELFVGRPPWSGDAMGLIAAIMTEDPPPPPADVHMPAAFAAAVRRALAKRPEDRFPTMHDLIKAIDAAGAPSLMGSMPAPVVPTSPSPGSPFGVPVPGFASQAAPYGGPPYYPPSVGLSRRYAVKDVADIFDRALGAQQRRFRFEEIAQAASEVGVDQITLHEAMAELARRGAVPPSDIQREEDRIRVKRLLAIYGIIAGFFFFINIFSDWRELWFQYPSVCIAVPFSLMIVRILFRAPKRKTFFQVGDAMLEHDVARVAQHLRTRPPPPITERVRVAAPLPPPTTHPASPIQAPSPIQQRIAPNVPAKSETLIQAEAEVEALLSTPHEAERAARRRGS